MVEPDRPHVTNNTVHALFMLAIRLQAQIKNIQVHHRTSHEGPRMGVNV